MFKNVVLIQKDSVKVTWLISNYFFSELNKISENDILKGYVSNSVPKIRQYCFPVQFLKGY